MANNEDQDWTHEDHEQLMHLIWEFGNEPKKIAKFLKTQSIQSIESKINNLLETRDLESEYEDVLRILDEQNKIYHKSTQICVDINHCFNYNH